MTETILDGLFEVEFQIQACSIRRNELDAKARKQLHVAVVLLDKGYSPYDEVAPLLEKYGRLSKIPDKRNKQ